MNRFPLRTLVLMALAILSILYFWYSTHRWLPASPQPVRQPSFRDAGGV